MDKPLARIIIAITVISLAIFANFIAIRYIGRYAIEANFYDKLSVAYDIGGVKGLERELAKMEVQSGERRQFALAESFQKKLPGLKEPEVFVDNALSEKKGKSILLYNRRVIALALVSVVFLFRVFVLRRLARAKKPE